MFNESGDGLGKLPSIGFRRPGQTRQITMPVMAIETH
jgi:hypothetical protein